jgi:hypothetical protein
MIKRPFPKYPIFYSPPNNSPTFLSHTQSEISNLVALLKFGKYLH